MDDYAMRRREYVQQVRASFDMPEEERNIPEWEDTDNTEGVENPFFSFKLRLTISVLLFFVVFFCKYNDYPIFGIEVSEIIDMISDNQYYTFLENCDILEDVILFFDN